MKYICISCSRFFSGLLKKEINSITNNISNIFPPENLWFWYVSKLNIFCTNSAAVVYIYYNKLHTTHIYSKVWF